MVEGVDNYLFFRIDFSFQRSFIQREGKMEGKSGWHTWQVLPVKEMLWAVPGAVGVSDHTEAGQFHSQLCVCASYHSAECTSPTPT